MIKIAGTSINADALLDTYPPRSLERQIISILSSSAEVYNFQSEQQLKFEVALRKKIVDTAKELARSRFSFRIFRKSKCNTNYWERTEEGGFLLKEDVKPSKAIEDIFINSSKYGTECATAIVIVYYKALLAVYPEELFNTLFSKIYLMDWQHLDPKLGIRHYRNIVDSLPGDCRYFKNPDVDPLTPEWQGENTIDLGEDSYYGHGMGIRTAEGVIAILNHFRKEGSETSAYLLDSATRLDFKSLANKVL